MIRLNAGTYLVDLRVSAGSAADALRAAEYAFVFVFDAAAVAAVVVGATAVEVDAVARRDVVGSFRVHSCCRHSDESDSNATQSKPSFRLSAEKYSNPVAFAASIRV